MKRIPAPSRLTKLSSFTLVELLVVMGIIAILAAVTLNIGSVALNAAKRAKAANMATQIQTACLNYYTEYSVYPVPTQGTPADVSYGTNDANDWEPLTYALCGNINVANPAATVTSTVANTRAIAFLNLKASDADANGVPVNPISPSSVAGPYFNIAINSSYSGVLGVGTSAVQNMPNFTTTAGSWAAGGGSSTAGIAVWANCNPNASTTNQAFWVHTY